MIHRGEVYDAEFPIGGIHPAIVVTREQAIPVLSSVAVVLITTTVRGHPAEMALSSSDELDLADSVANCDDIATLPKARLGRHRGRLSIEEGVALNRALAVALGLD